MIGMNKDTYLYPHRRGIAIYGRPDSVCVLLRRHVGAVDSELHDGSVGVFGISMGMEGEDLKRTIKKSRNEMCWYSGFHFLHLPSISTRYVFHLKIVGPRQIDFPCYP